MYSNVKALGEDGTSKSLRFNAESIQIAHIGGVFTKPGGTRYMSMNHARA